MNDKNTKLDPASLNIENLVKVLRASGSNEITEEKVQTDIDEGLPVNADGSINLIHYAAWMVKEMGRGRD
jgi:hypothetical protein